MAGGEASSERLLPALVEAFAAPNAKAVVLNINSPGGSPVQAGILFDELQLLKQAHPEKTLYAVIGDVVPQGHITLRLRQIIFMPTKPVLLVQLVLLAVVLVLIS